MNHLITSIPRIIMRNCRHISTFDIQERYTEQNPYNKKSNEYNEYNNYNQFYNSKQFLDKNNNFSEKKITKSNDVLKNISNKDIPLL